MKAPDYRLNDRYRQSVLIAPNHAVATAGSCFAQKIGRELRRPTARFLDLEPVPYGMSEVTAARLGFGMFSAQFGNIYSTAQLLQLAEDALTGKLRDEAFWELNGSWYDGLPPRLEPGGYASLELARAARVAHTAQVRRMFSQANVFVFTLSLTKRWQDERSGTVYPNGLNSGRMAVWTLWVSISTQN